MLCTNIFYFSWNACFALLFPVTTARKHQDQIWICLHFSGIYWLLVKWILTLVLSHRMTTSWMCCSCWWLWCLNILVPWSRLLTSATGFGKRGRLISALVSKRFLDLPCFLKSVGYFFNHASEAWMLSLFDRTFFSIYIEPLFFLFSPVWFSSFWPQKAKEYECRRWKWWDIFWKTCQQSKCSKKPKIQSTEL